ncbi:IS982 family transposase [Candidatus Electronema aureum]
MDKHRASGLFICAERMSNNSNPEFSDAEVLTVYLWGIMNGHRKVKPSYEYVRNHLKEWFPKLRAYATYIQRLNRLPQVFAGLLSLIQNDFAPLPDAGYVHLIDSMPIMTANARRSSRAKVSREINDKGYNSVKETYFCGLKLHIFAVRRNGRLPLPDYIGITPASTADINVLKEIADDLHDTSVYADKAYVSNALKQRLEEQNTSLNTPVKRKKGQKFSVIDEILSSAVSMVRQPIESLFNWIDEKTGIQTASKVRSTQGLLVHVYGKLAAAMLLLTPIFNS